MRRYFLNFLVLFTLPVCQVHAEPILVPVSEGTLTEPVGIAIIGGIFSPLIEKGSLLPASNVYTFSTIQANMSSVKIKYYLGTCERVRPQMCIGTALIEGISPALAGEPAIEVQTHVSNTGEFSVQAIQRKPHVLELSVSISNTCETHQMFVVEGDAPHCEDEILMPLIR